jgi:hypothetical protein
VNIENIINVNVVLSQGNTVATAEWTSNQVGSYGNLYYAQGYPNDGSLVYSLVSIGPTAFPQNTFSVPVPGLNPALPYSFYVQTVLADDTTVVAEMGNVDYLLNPLSLSGVVPVSSGYPLSGPIALGSNRAIDLVQGDIPQVGDVLDGLFQYLTVEKIGKLINSSTAFQVVETTVQIPFRGLIVPEKAWELQFKPVAQRTWKFYKLFAESVLPLFTDDVVLWQGNQYRIVSLTDWAQFGYFEYSLAQDWTSRGPTT